MVTWTERNGCAKLGLIGSESEKRWRPSRLPNDDPEDESACGRARAGEINASA